MISVIITTKNREKLLQRAINTVLQQTHKDWEMIIVDDNSCDGTKEYCESICNEKIRYIRIEEKESHGGNYARNKGIMASNGEYIALLDDDDEWDETKLEKQYEVFNKTLNDNLALVYTAVENINMMYNSKVTYKKIINKRNINSKKEILISNCIGNTSNPLIKKNIFEEVGMFDENLSACQEHELWIRICQKYETYLINEPLTKYYTVIDADKQISGNPEKYISSIYYINTKHKDKLSELNTQEKKERDYQIFSNTYMRYLISGDKKNARKYIFKAMKIKVRMKNCVNYVASFFKYSTYLKIRLIFWIIKLK